MEKGKGRKNEQERMGEEEKQSKWMEEWLRRTALSGETQQRIAGNEKEA